MQPGGRRLQWYPGRTLGDEAHRPRRGERRGVASGLEEDPEHERAVGGAGENAEPVRPHLHARDGAAVLVRPYHLQLGAWLAAAAG